MALHTVGDLKQDVTGMLQKIDLTKVYNLYGAFQRAAREMVQRVNVPEASDKQTITLYDGVTYYAAPTTIFGGALITLRQQGNAPTPIDYNYRVPIDEFTRTRAQLPNGFLIDFEYLKGIGRMGIVSPIPMGKAVLDPMTATTGWVATGTATAFTLDQTVYFNPPAALRSTITVGTGIFTKTITAQNLLTYKGVGVAFLAVRIPSTTLLTNMELRIGSSSTKYSTLTVSQGFLGAWQTGDWTLIAFDQSLATDVNTPNWSAITYLQLLVTGTGTLTNFYVGGLWVSLPSACEMIFQTDAIWNAAGTLGQTIPGDPVAGTGDSTTIILNDSAYTILEHESAIQVAMQQGGSAASAVIAALKEVLFGVRARNGLMVKAGLYDLYQFHNPSQETPQIGNWYDD